ncbi:MAG: hypothetical protein IGS39_00185 [Calothrix sp. C42_A2020_038]|nr:hypothetical protein [Calothrix sp. C42_A2020_038]
MHILLDCFHPESNNLIIQKILVRQNTQTLHQEQLNELETRICNFVDLHLLADTYCPVIIGTLIIFIVNYLGSLLPTILYIAITEALISDNKFD